MQQLQTLKQELAEARAHIQDLEEATIASQLDALDKEPTSLRFNGIPHFDSHGDARIPHTAFESGSAASADDDMVEVPIVLARESARMVREPMAAAAAAVARAQCNLAPCASYIASCVLQPVSGL